MRIIATIISWIFSIILIISGIVYIQSLACIFFFLPGLMLLPPLYNFIKPRLKYKTWQKVIAITACIILAVIVLPNTPAATSNDSTIQKASNSSSTINSSSKKTDKVDEDKATAEYLAQIRNPIASDYITENFNQKDKSNITFVDNNKNNFVRWTAHIKKISNKNEIVLQEDGYPEIHASFGYDIEKYENIKVGDIVTITGNPVGYHIGWFFVYWILNNCRVEKTTADEKSFVLNYKATFANEKAAAKQAIADKAASANAAASKAVADKAAADKAAADKAAADKAAADKAASDKAAADKEKYYAQFTWYNNDFGIIIDSANIEYGFFTAKGRAISFNNISYSYVQIDIGLYAKNGNKIGTAWANINDLSAGTTWQFEATGSTSTNGSCNYKVESIECW